MIVFMLVMRFKNLKPCHIAVNAEINDQIHRKQQCCHPQNPRIAFFLCATGRVGTARIVAINFAAGAMNNPSQNHHHTGKNNDRDFVFVDRVVQAFDHHRSRTDQSDVRQDPQNRDQSRQNTAKHVA